MIGLALESDGAAEYVEFVAAYAGTAGGRGAGIGAIVNVAKAQDNLLYQAPATPGSVSLWPIVSPRHQGVALTMRW